MEEWGGWWWTWNFHVILDSLLLRAGDVLGRLATVLVRENRLVLMIWMLLLVVVGLRFGWTRHTSESKWFHVSKPRFYVWPLNLSVVTCGSCVGGTSKLYNLKLVLHIEASFLASVLSSVQDVSTLSLGESFGWNVLKADDSWFQMR